MIGKTLSHYRIVEQIGVGGMGIVYRARDERLGRDVALKFLPAEFAADTERLGRFEREARATSALNHPNIVTIYEVGAFGSLHYIAMEYLTGRTLREMLAAAPLPMYEVLRVAAQVAQGLAHAHAAGIVHRDLKPGNIMLTQGGLAKILDFGLAKLAEGQAEPAGLEEATRDALATRPGTVMGTPGYMSPEQAGGEPISIFSDQFSFGCMLYEMATGKSPFERSTPNRSIAAVLYEEPEPISRINPQVPDGLWLILSRCLEKDPGHRYADTRKLARDIEALQFGLMLETLRPSRAPEAAPALAAAMPPKQRFTRRNVLLVATAGAFVVLATLFGINVGGMREKFLGRGGPPRIKAIAVLPLENLSGDASQEYFADGMTEAIITELAQISAFKKVTSRTSVMLYKAKPKPMPEIARELGVDAVIEGSVQRAGDKVGITVQLIDPAADRHLWAKSYERDARDILSLQRDVARAIADEIRLKLTPGEQARLAGAHAVNAAAHEFYLKGRYFWNQRGEGPLVKSVDYFQKAIEQDPGYAPAYAGLADAYSILGGNRYRDPHEVFPKAEAAALRALELDDTLSEAHAALGAIKANYGWDWVRAQRELKRAVELNPGNSNAHHRYGYLLTTLGQHDQAVAELRRARELDPFFSRLRLALGDVLLNARRYDQAFQELQQALEVNPNDDYMYFMLGRVYMGKRMYSEAITAFQQGPNQANQLGRLGHAYAVSGKPNEARKVLSELLRLSKRRYVAASDIALIHIGLGDKDQAFAWLEKAYQDRDRMLVYLRNLPEYDPLRSEPRFQDLVRRMNFPQ